MNIQNPIKPFQTVNPDDEGGMPNFVPPSPNPIWKNPQEDIGFDPVVGHCPKCNLELRRVMCYTCTRTHCPCFPQATC